MKKINKNIIVFALVAIFILSGVASKNMMLVIGRNFYHLIKGESSVSEFISGVESTSVKDLNYYNFLNDLNSLRLNVLNNCILQKEDDLVVKMENGYLTNAASYVDDDSIKDCVKNIQLLQSVCESNNSKFLYVLAPDKDYYGTYPQGLENYSKSNINRFISCLDDSGINYLNLIDKMDEDGLSWEDSFFITDHHWTPKTGFWANRKICERLNQDFDFQYNESYTDIDNYEIKTYKDWFLGSSGKKVGKYFTELGVDDIDLITPLFETNLTEEQPLKNLVKTGDFENTVIYTENIYKKDYYSLNAYAAYHGGDFRQQIVTNNLIKSDVKILVIRDSYACVVTPFLSLQAKETHIVDVRNYSYYYGDKPNMKDYIEAENPDYVIVLYKACPTVDNRTDFF